MSSFSRGKKKSKTEERVEKLTRPRTLVSKLASNSKAYATAQRLIKSYFVSLQSLLATTSSESGVATVAVAESSKLVPWIVGNRKVARAWTRLLLGLYDSSADETRVAALLALRKLAVATDDSLRETVIKVR